MSVVPETSSTRPLLIVNPSSGGGLSERRRARLVTAAAAEIGAMDVSYTEARGHAITLAREAALAGRKLVIALGGDGTISEVANGLLEARQAGGGAGSVELGIIPRGTGGDFRRTLELPSDPAAAARRIAEGKPRLIDVGKVTYTGADGQRAVRHFLNVASFGFSSSVAARANGASKALGGKIAFLGATIRTLIAYDNQDVLLEIDGAQPIRRTVMLGAVGNGRFFGGGMKICPTSSLDDGRLAFVVVGDMGKAQVVRDIRRLYDGTHLQLEDVQSWEIRSLRATPAVADARIPVEIDGETPGHLPATFEILPHALPLRF